MKLLAFSVFTMINLNIVLAQESVQRNDTSKQEKFKIMDTIHFEGMMIMDLVINNSIFLITKNDCSRVKTNFKKEKNISKFLNKVDKLDFLETRTFQSLILKYDSISTQDRLCMPHIPSINGVSVFVSDKNENIYFSLYSGNLVRTRIHVDLLKDLGISYQSIPLNGYVDFYSFTDLNRL